MAKAVDNKLNNIPADIRAYLTSLRAAELNLFIAQKNKLKDDQVYMLIELVSRLFSKELKLSDLVAVISRNFGLDDLAVKSLACDVAGIRLLPVKDWLGEDVEKYIKDWGGDPAEYIHYTEEQKKAVAEEAKYFAEETKVEPEFSFKPKTPAEEPRPSLDIATEKADSISLFKQNLETALYSNAEELTVGHIKGEGKEIAPTIANWIKDFIKDKGSEMFDELALADYLSSSISPKALNADDKTLLRRLLRLYRNLSFFPASMGNAPLGSWEIIPVKKEEDTIGAKAASIPAAPRPARPQAAIAPSPAAPQLIQDGATIAELERLLKDYPVSSLEHKAISQEISRFRKAELKKTQKAKSR